VLGGLFFGHEQVGRFTEQHAQLVVGVAAQAAIALDNARLFAETEKSGSALKSSNLELRQANADLEQFAYAAAHDLQEPLRMVTSYTQLLERSLAEILDDRTRTFMSYVVGGSIRMTLLLQDLLAYTETSRASDPNERVLLGRVLHQVVRNLDSVIKESGAEIVWGDLPVVRGREAHFVQLLQNLLSNALKYRKPSVPPVIHISAERQKDRWLIRVADNGIGIASAYHKQVFGVFKRLHGSEIPGTGIGLAICQRVVERAGGEIWVESIPEQGSTFVISLPADPNGQD
jgi:light-regulated signal transduction histidine kinase (bacteriophytochrome)